MISLGLFLKHTNMSNIIIRPEGNIESLPAKEVLTTALEKFNSEKFFLASDLYVGNWNQAGFVIGDRQPKPRPYWLDADIMRYSEFEVENEIRLGMIPEERRGFYDTSKSMAALRYFAIPEELEVVFKKDKFLGMPLLKKICEENAVPEYFDELDVIAPYRHRIDEYDPYSASEDSSKLLKIIEQVISPLHERTGQKYKFYPYVTYFPTAMFPIIVPTLQESVQMVTGRFDQFAERFNIGNNRPQIKRNPLLIDQK